MNKAVGDRFKYMVTGMIDKCVKFVKKGQSVYVLLSIFYRIKNKNKLFMALFEVQNRLIKVNGIIRYHDKYLWN